MRRIHVIYSDGDEALGLAISDGEVFRFLAVSAAFSGLEGLPFKTLSDIADRISANELSVAEEQTAA